MMSWRHGRRVQLRPAVDNCDKTDNRHVVDGDVERPLVAIHRSRSHNSLPGYSIPLHILHPSL